MTTTTQTVPTLVSDGRHPDARLFVHAVIERILRPPKPLPPSKWASENLIVPDGPRAGEPWSIALTPYIQEPLDFMGTDSPVNEIAIRKSAQTGFTTLAIAMIGHSIDRDPCRMMVIQPTDSALSEFNRDKLQPSIDGSRVLREKVADQKSRSAMGSTTYSKRYPGGSLTLALASSSADLRSKTVKKMIRDEIDQYPDDLDGQGDPLKISDGRLISFLSQGDWKKIDISTPTIKGGSKIDRRFEAGDQRYWRFPCPHCGDLIGFEWGDQFRFSRDYPHNPEYLTPCCGSFIQAHERNALVSQGQWVATKEGAGRYPSYHFDALSSPFVPWNEICKAYIAASNDHSELKTFWNLWLGLPYEMRGDAPDHERLMLRREPDLKQGHIPARGLILTAAADVQMRGIWYLVKATAPNRETWVVDALYLDGDTSSPEGGAFDLLRAQLDRDFPDAWGGDRRLDVLGVDSGYRSHVVYAWSRQNQRLHPHTGRDIVLCLKGRDGWGHPAIGMPSLVDIDLGGKKIRKGAKVWSVGTWPLKGAYYDDLRKEGIQSGLPQDPAGMQHFGTWLDESFFRQVTSEYLTDERVRGVERRIWKIRSSQRDNHFLDCEVYCRALVEYLGISRMTGDDWATLAQRHGAVLDGPVPLFAERQPESAPPPLDDKPKTALSNQDPPSGSSSWLPDTSGWFNRR